MTVTVTADRQTVHLSPPYACDGKENTCSSPTFGLCDLKFALPGRFHLGSDSLLEKEEFPILKPVKKLPVNPTPEIPPAMILICPDGEVAAMAGTNAIDSENSEIQLKNHDYNQLNVNGSTFRPFAYHKSIVQVVRGPDMTQQASDLCAELLEESPSQKDMGSDSEEKQTSFRAYLKAVVPFKKGQLIAKIEGKIAYCNPQRKKDRQ